MPHFVSICQIYADYVMFQFVPLQQDNLRKLTNFSEIFGRDRPSYKKWSDSFAGDLLDVDPGILCHFSQLAERKFRPHRAVLFIAR